MATPTQFRNEAPTPGRPRALALVEAQIPEAEIDRDRWLTVVAALTATKQPCRRENAMLRWAEERVALLHRSRAILEAELWPRRGDRTKESQAHTARKLIRKLWASFSRAVSKGSIPGHPPSRCVLG